MTDPTRTPPHWTRIYVDGPPFFDARKEKAAWSSSSLANHRSIVEAEPPPPRPDMDQLDQYDEDWRIVEAGLREFFAALALVVLALTFGATLPLLLWWLL